MSFLNRNAPPNINFQLKLEEIEIGRYKTKGGDFDRYVCEPGFLIVTNKRVVFFKKKNWQNIYTQHFSHYYPQIYSIKFKGGYEKEIFINGYSMWMDSKNAKNIFKDIKKLIKESKENPVNIAKDDPIKNINPPQAEVQKSKFCIYCGEKNDVDAKFCNSCGREDEILSKK